MTPNVLKDALYNTSRENIFEETAITYARGMVVGVVSALMMRVSYQVAIRALVENLPEDFLIYTIPDAWKNDVFMEAKRQGKWRGKLHKSPIVPIVGLKPEAYD